MVLDGFGRVWEGLGGVGRGWEGWGRVGRVPSPLEPPRKGLRVLGGGYFVYIFSGFAIDRSKKYVKTIKIYVKIDDVVGFNRYPGTTGQLSTCWIDWCYQNQHPD